MKTITSKIIALALVMSGIIFSHTAIAACSKPTGLNTTAITATSATLNWSAVSGALNYNIRYRIVNASTWTTVNALTSTTTTISSLTASSNYEWQAQTRCSSTQTSQWTTSSTFNTLAACNVPAGLNATNITSSGATLNWTAVSGAVGYNIQYRIVGAPSWTSTTSSSTSKAITSLTSASNYEWQVQTDCGSSNLSAFSSSSTFTTSTPPCNVPSGLNTTGVTHSDATLTWTAVSGAVGYNVQYRVVGAPSWTTTTSSSTSTTLTTLTASSNYEWQVQTDCGNSNFSVFSSLSTFATTVAPCNTPAGLNISSLTSTSVDLNWGTVSGAVGYNVEYRSLGAPSWTSAATTATLFSITGLTSTTGYEWQVQADCGNSNLSSFSSPNTFTTHAPPCLVPTGLVTSGITLADATFDWTAVAGAVDYKVRHRELGASAWNTTTSSTTTVTISGLNAHGNYEWQVQSSCGNSNYSAFSPSSYFVADPNVVPITTFYGTWLGADVNGNAIEIVLNSNSSSTFTINGTPLSNAGDPGGAVTAYRLPQYRIQTSVTDADANSSSNAPAAAGTGRVIKFFTSNAMHGITAPAASTVSQTVTSISMVSNTVQQVYTGLAVITLNGSGQYEMALFIDLNQFSSVPPAVDFSINPMGDIPAYANLIKQ